MQIPVQPRIAVNDKEQTIQSLANRDKYTLTSSTITNGVAVYVLTLHNVSVSDNGTRFECYVRSSRSRITSGNVKLNIRYKGACGYTYMYIHCMYYECMRCILHIHEDIL